MNETFENMAAAIIVVGVGFCAVYGFLMLAFLATGVKV